MAEVLPLDYNNKVVLFEKGVHQFFLGIIDLSVLEKQLVCHTVKEWPNHTCRCLDIFTPSGLSVVPFGHTMLFLRFNTLSSLPFLPW